MMNRRISKQKKVAHVGGSNGFGIHCFISMLLAHRCLYKVVYKDFRVSQSQIKQYWNSDITETFDRELTL